MARRSTNISLRRVGELVSILAGLATLVALLFSADAREAVSDGVHWLSEPVDTPRVVFLLVLVLASAAGMLVLAWLVRALFERRDETTPIDRAEDFRGAFEEFTDTLRRWRMEGDPAARNPQYREHYRTMRRRVAASYSHIRSSFNEFLVAHPEWDLNPPPDLYDDHSYMPEIDEPFTKLWMPNSLPTALGRWRDMDGDDEDAMIAARSDALDAYIDWVKGV